MFVDLCAHPKTTADSPQSDPARKDGKNGPTASSLWLSGATTSLPSSVRPGKTFSPFHSPSPTYQYSSDNLPLMDRSCKGFVRIPGNSRQLNIRGAPLQLAGVSKSLESSLAYSGILKPALKGCMKNLRINRELKDLGNSLLSHRSFPGCKNAACRKTNRNCGQHGKSCIENSAKEKECLCDLGWSGQECNQPTVPTFFEKQSFATVALSFTPLSFSTSVQLRFRTWSSSGEMVRLSSSLGRDSLSLRLTKGRVCFVFTKGKPQQAREVCLDEVAANDGRWHAVTAQRVASSLLLQMDEGDWSNQNSSLSLEDQSTFEISPHDGCHVGGKPEYKDGKVAKVHEDFYEGCIDDIRVDSHALPLPPSINGTEWGQVTSHHNVKEGCAGEPMCSRFSCRPPLQCFDTWNSYSCSCGEGKRLSFDGTVCDDINECQWTPCLNGGACHNSVPGFWCQCQAGFDGKNCEISVNKRLTFPSTVGVVAGVVSLCFFLLIIICVIVLVKRYYSTYSRADLSLDEDQTSSGDGSHDHRDDSDPTHIRSIELVDKSILTRTYSCRHYHQREPVSALRDGHFGGSYLDLNLGSGRRGQRPRTRGKNPLTEIEKNSQSSTKGIEVLGHAVDAKELEAFQSDPRLPFEAPTRKCKSVTFLTGDAGTEMMYLKTKDIQLPPPCKCMKGLGPPLKDAKASFDPGPKSKKMSFPIMNPLVKEKVSDLYLEK